MPFIQLLFTQVVIVILFTSVHVVLFAFKLKSKFTDLHPNLCYLLSVYATVIFESINHGII